MECIVSQDLDLFTRQQALSAKKFWFWCLVLSGFLTAQRLTAGHSHSSSLGSSSLKRRNVRRVVKCAALITKTGSPRSLMTDYRQFSWRHWSLFFSAASSPAICWTVVVSCSFMHSYSALYWVIAKSCSQRKVASTHWRNTGLAQICCFNIRTILCTWILTFETKMWKQMWDLNLIIQLICKCNFIFISRTDLNITNLWSKHVAMWFILIKIKK